MARLYDTGKDTRSCEGETFWVGQSCSSCQLSYFSLNTFILWGCSLWFGFSEHDVLFIICCPGKWNSASRVTIQANCSLTFTLPFCSHAHCTCLIFLLSNMCILVKNAFFFFPFCLCRCFIHRRATFLAWDVKCTFKVTIPWFPFCLSVLLSEQHCELHWLVSSFFLRDTHKTKNPSKKASGMEKNLHVDDLAHFRDKYPSGAVWFRGIRMDRFKL